MHTFFIKSLFNIYQGLKRNTAKISIFEKYLMFWDHTMYKIVYRSKCWKKSNSSIEKKKESNNVFAMHEYDISLKVRTESLMGPFKHTF